MLPTCQKIFWQDTEPQTSIDAVWLQMCVKGLKLHVGPLAPVDGSEWMHDTGVFKSSQNSHENLRSTYIRKIPFTFYLKAQPHRLDC